MLMVCFASGLALGAPPVTLAPAPVAPPIAAEPEPPPPPAPEPESEPESAPKPEAPAAAPVSPAPVSPAPVSPAPVSPAPVAPAPVAPAPPLVAPPTTPFARDYDAMPLTLEARFGFNARLGSSFDASADDQMLDTAYGFAAYLAWNREDAFGLELEHSGLGRVRALSAQNSIDAEYSATSAWLGARVFPWRTERLDVFVNLRLGLAFQHVDALGTRQQSSSITVPAPSFSCSVWDGPGIALGAALGLDYRLGRHVAFITRLDATGERLSGAELGTCADGIGSVTTIAGSVGLAYEFETARH